MARAFGTRTERKDGKNQTWLFFRAGLPPELERDVTYVKRVMGLDQHRSEYALTGSARAGSSEIGLLTRSLHEISTELAAGVDVPEEDIAQGRAARFGAIGHNVGSTDAPLLHVDSGNTCPDRTYSAIRYRGRCFWIDDRDLRSKRVFLFVLMFTSLAESQIVPQVPILTTSTR